METVVVSNMIFVAKLSLSNKHVNNGELGNSVLKACFHFVDLSWSLFIIIHSHL